MVETYDVEVLNLLTKGPSNDKEAVVGRRKKLKVKRAPLRLPLSKKFEKIGPVELVGVGLIEIECVGSDGPIVESDEDWLGERILRNFLSGKSVGDVGPSTCDGVASDVGPSTCDGVAGDVGPATCQGCCLRACCSEW